MTGTWDYWINEKQEIQHSITPSRQRGMAVRINSFVTPESLREEIVTLSPAESHHLARVLRVEPGQELTLFDGQGTRASGIVDSVTKKKVTVRVTGRETVPPPAVEVTLIQAVCKPDRFEMIL